MSYREKVKNQPLGTPMDLHFFGGIPYGVHMARQAKLSALKAPKPSESVVVLPLEDAGHRERKRKGRR